MEESVVQRKYPVVVEGVEDVILNVGVEWDFLFVGATR